MENDLPNPGRTPKQDDLVALCRALNACGARYLVIGGFAVIHHGYLRATEDIDLLWLRGAEVRDEDGNKSFLGRILFSLV